MQKKEERSTHSVSSKHSSSHKEFYSKLAVIGVVVVLVIGVFLFAELKGVGKAVGDVPLSGYYYNPNASNPSVATGEGFVYYEKKVEQADDDNSDCNINNKGKWKCDENCPYPNKKPYTYCYSTYDIVNNDDGEDIFNELECYAPFSVTREGGADRLCVNPENYSKYKSEGYYLGDSGGLYNGYNWINCSGDAKGKVHLDKFYCGKNKKFYPCIAETNEEVNPEKERTYLCVASSKKWVTCESSLSTKIQLDKFLCNSSNKWQECTSTKITSNKKYYCEKESDKWKWKECAKAGLSADLKAYCEEEGTMWKWTA